MLWRAMAPPRAAPRAVLPLGGGAATPTDDLDDRAWAQRQWARSLTTSRSRRGEAQGTAAVLAEMRERGLCGDGETRAEGWRTTEGCEGKPR